MKFQWNIPLEAFNSIKSEIQLGFPPKTASKEDPKSASQENSKRRLQLEELLVLAAFTNYFICV